MHPYTTDMYEGMLAETIMLPGHDGEIINAYYARPLGPGPFPGVVLIHHMPGWDELYREFTRKFAHHGYLAISPNIYFRFGHGSPDDMSAKVRGSGGVPDASVVGDIDASARFPNYPSVSYRPEAAVDGWKKMFTFFEKNLETSGRGR